MGSDAKKNYDAEGRIDALLFDPEVLVIVEEDPTHPLYDERALDIVPDEATVVSMMEQGNLEAVQVRRNGRRKGKDTPYIVEVVNGRNRTRAAREANKRFKKMGSDKRVFIKALIVQGTDIELLKHMIAANELRRNDGPMIKARKLQRLLTMGCPHEDAHKVFGVSPSTIRNWLKLLDCADVVQKAIDAGKVPASIAQELCELPREEQKAKLEEMIANGQTHGAQGREAVDRAKRGESTPDGEPVVRMRSRKFLESFSKELRKNSQSEYAALVDFILGKETALNRQAELREIAAAAGWVKRDAKEKETAAT